MLNENFWGVKTYVGKDHRIVEYLMEELSRRTTVDTTPAEEHMIDYPEDYVAVGRLKELYFDHVDVQYPEVDIKEFIEILEQEFPKKEAVYPLEHIGIEVLAWDYDKELAITGTLVDVDSTAVSGNVRHSGPFLVRTSEVFWYKHIEVI